MLEYLFGQPAFEIGIHLLELRGHALDKFGPDRHRVVTKLMGGPDIKGIAVPALLPAASSTITLMGVERETFMGTAK